MMRALKIQMIFVWAASTAAAQMSVTSRLKDLAPKPTALTEQILPANDSFLLGGTYPAGAAAEVAAYGPYITPYMAKMEAEGITTQDWFMQTTAFSAGAECAGGEYTCPVPTACAGGAYPDNGNCQSRAVAAVVPSLSPNANAANSTADAQWRTESSQGNAELTGNAYLGPYVAPAFTVSVAGVSAQQALITYTAPSSSPCTIKTSTNSSLTPAVLDVDPNTFANANSDLSRASTVRNGLERAVVIGQRTAQYASAGTYSGVRHFSRSLAPLTTYYGNVTCDSSTANFSFTTTNIPLGQIYGDPWLSDPANPGDQPWPEAAAGSTPESFNDPVRGANLVRVGLRNNQATSWNIPFASAFNQGQTTPCDSAGPWTSPCGIVTGGSGSTRVGNSTNPLVLRIPMQNYPPWTTNYGSGFSLDQLSVSLTGSVDSSNPTLRTLNACLSMNGGISCASPVYSAIAPRTSGAIAFGQASASTYGVCGGTFPCWLLDTKPRINSQETIAHQGTGTIANVSGTYYMANTGGDSFSLYWVTGGAGTMRVSTVSQSDACASPPASSTASEYRIASLTDPTGAGLNGNYLQFASGSTPPTGSVYWCEQNFAVMIWRATAPTDGSTVTLSASSTTAYGSYIPGIPDNGAGTACFNTLVYGGYFCLWGHMYWINPSTSPPTVAYWGQPVSSDNGSGTAALANSWFRTTAGSANIDQTKSNFTFNLVASDNCWYVGGACSATDTKTSGPLVVQVVFTPSATPVQPATPQGGGSQIGNATITASDAYSATWSVTSPSPWTMKWTNLTPQVSSTTCLGVSGVGCGIVQQMATFDSSFVPAEFDQGSHNWTCGLSAATSQGILVFPCNSYNGDSSAWVLAFAPGDGNPAHAGQTGGPQIIGAINTFNTPKGAVANGQAALTGHSLHTVVESGETGWFGIIANEEPNFTTSSTTIPAGGNACSAYGLSIAGDCIAVQMNSYTHDSATGYEPYFLASAIPVGFKGTPGELRTTQLGDTACFSSSSSSCGWAAQANELMTLRIKNYGGTPGLSVFQRGTYGGSSTEKALSGTYYLFWESYQSSSPVCVYCASQGVQAWWNPTAGCGGSPDPHGDCLKQDNNISIGHGEYRSGGESVTVNVPHWAIPQSILGAQAAWPGDWQVEQGAVPTFFSLASANETPPPVSPCPPGLSNCTFSGYVPGVNFVSINPPFDGVYGTPFAADAQTHPNAPGVNATTHNIYGLSELNQAFDNVCMTGEGTAPAFCLVRDGSSTCGTVTSGQLYRARPATVTDPDDFFSYNSTGTPPAGNTGATYINRKILATAASCGNHPLIDVSGPSSTIGTGSASAYTYCIARANGECVSGSLIGDIYANCPGVGTPGPETNAVGCNNGSYHGGTPFGMTNDICFQNQTATGDSIVQYTLQYTDYYGAYTRALANATSRLRMVTNFENNTSLPDGSMLFYRAEFLNLDRQDLWALQLPPYPPTDSTNRGTFVPISVSFTPPGGTNTTLVDFGYQEYAQGGTPYCTTRLDMCEATAATAPTGFQPFKFASETPVGLACGSSLCSIEIPAISQRMLYYRLRYQDSGGGTISIGPWKIQVVP